MPEANLQETARLVGVSEPTLKEMIRKDADFPVMERGARGLSWKFDTRAVAKHLKKRRNEERAAQDQIISHRGQPDLLLTAKSGGVLDDQLKTYKIRELERIDARENGKLAPVDEISAALASTIRRLGQMQDAGLERVGRTLNLPDAVMRALRREFADMRVAFVRETGEFLTADDKSSLIA